MPIEATALHVRSDDSMSDHCMIRFAIKRDKPASIWCRNVKRTNWQLYEDELKESISLWFGQVETPADIERELNVLNTAVIEAFHKRVQNTGSPAGTKFLGGTRNLQR